VSPGTWLDSLIFPWTVGHEFRDDGQPHMTTRMFLDHISYCTLCCSSIDDCYTYAQPHRDWPLSLELHMTARHPVPELALALERVADGPRLRLLNSDDSIAPESVPLSCGAAWTCGLALFPYTLHHGEQQVARFIDYLTGILPVCSAIWGWREFVRDSRVGMYANADGSAAAAASIDWLYVHLIEASAAGEPRPRLGLPRFDWRRRRLACSRSTSSWHWRCCLGRAQDSARLRDGK
jgi:hypothetical protein